VELAVDVDVCQHAYEQSITGRTMAAALSPLRSTPGGQQQPDG